MPSKTNNKYTDPELRNEIKEEIQAGDKGGAPGQWSARKAQMMASEYRKRGGVYTTNEKDDGAKHLDQWTEENWLTKEGSGSAKDEDGTEHRYLPKKAWEEMSEKEKEETDAKKQEGSKQGKQHVSNTSKAAQARMDASKDDKTKEYTKIEKKSKTDCTTQWDDPDHMEDDQREYQKFLESNRKSKSPSHEDHAGKKRGRGANAEAPNKKQKSAGGKRDAPIGAAGDKTRVPKKGQKVQWHSLPGYVHGEVVEVVYEEKSVDGKSVDGKSVDGKSVDGKSVDGKSVKASKEDPRVVLKSDSSGKMCVHKPEAVYFD